MEEPGAVPVGAEGGAPIAAIAPAKPAADSGEAEVPVVQPVVATEAPALVAAPPSAAAPPRGGPPAERVPGEGGTPDAKEPKSEDGEGASATGLAPMRLNSSNFGAAAGQPKMSDQSRC